jgi:FixJ family two-component response regulator
VSIFPSGVEFLTSNHFTGTGFLIVDINVPVMTGVDLSKRLVEFGHATPTTLITAYADEAVRFHALNDGVIGHLLKPVDRDDLDRCLRLAFDKDRPRP